MRTCPRFTVPSLQRGRAPGGAELRVEEIEGGWVLLLQRGRAPGGAEFEGLMGWPDGWTDSLQRGRAPGGAEFRSTPRLTWLNPSASTGPRPGGRGILVFKHHHPAFGSLQRGRAPGGAELPSSCSPCCPQGRLQRGRAPGGAEFVLATFQATFRKPASTGPRPGGRGIPACLTLDFSVSSRASTGPRPGGRGITLHAFAPRWKA